MVLSCATPPAVAQSVPAVVTKRPDRQLFKPKAQIKAEEKAAARRQKQEEREQLRDLEEQKLAREKDARDQESAALAKKRQEALLRAIQPASQRELSKMDGAPWSKSKVSQLRVPQPI